MQYGDIVAFLTGDPAKGIIGKYAPHIKLDLIPYLYTMTFSALAPAGTATQPLSIAVNADFLFVELRSRANVAAAAQTVPTATLPLVRALITDSGSNDQCSNAICDLTLQASFGVNGNYASNGHLYCPRLISGRSAVSVQLTNFDAAATYNIDVVLAGVLVRALNA